MGFLDRLFGTEPQNPRQAQPYGQQPAAPRPAGYPSTTPPKSEDEIAIEPGMVLAFETPFYAKGIGALTIEDQILVTESGVDVMTDMPREMLELS